MSAQDNLSSQFERAKVPPSEVREGDYLDIGRKTRVHATRVRDDGSTVIAWRQRGSKAPGVHVRQADEHLNVWRRSGEGT